MRIRLPIGAIKPIKTIRVYQYRNNGTYGISQRENYSPYHLSRNDVLVLPFHAGITEPICGWDWLLNHEHPVAEYKITLQAHGCKSTITLCDNPSVDYGRIMREVCKLAFKPNIRRNGNGHRKLKKGQTFNPNYNLVKPKRKRNAVSQRGKQ